MNTQNLRPGVKLDEAEKHIMGRGGPAGPARADADPVRIYTAELNQLAEELGIDLLDEGANAWTPETKTSSESAPAPKPNTAGASAGRERRPSHARAYGGGAERSSASSGLWRQEEKRSADSPPASSAPKYGGADPRSVPGGAPPIRPPMRAGNVIDLIDELDLSADEAPAAPKTGGRNAAGRGESGSETDSESGSGSDSGSESGSESGSGSDSSGSGSETGSDSSGSGSESGSESGSDTAEPGDDEVDRIIERLEGDLGIQTDGRRERRRRRLHRTELPDRPERSDRVTDEQERRRHINSVVADIRGETRTSFGVEQERAQDLKASKLEQIGQLRMALEEEGIDCSAVTAPTAESSLDEIDSVLKVLRLKNDRNRYSSLAEEVILGFAEGIETVFDGSRPIPILGFRPDYTGYNSTVNCKLHRMRYETSTVVGNIIDKYDIGPTTRIIMELLPSFFLYPRQQRKQRGAPGLSSDPHVADARGAFASIHDSDRRKNLDDVRNI